MRQISASELQNNHLFLGSPQFGGQCSTIFARSLADLAIITGNYHIPFDTRFYMNESLITRARNLIADEFLRGRGTHLLFVDADIGFAAQDALELFILAIQNPQYEIIGGPYKKKTLTNEYAFNFEPGTDFNSAEPVEVTGIGTGFMLIKRETFAHFDNAFPEFVYKTDDENPHSIMQYFQAEIDPASRRYLSEDYWFSKRCAELGIRTWLCPWMKLRHAGTQIFE